MLSDGTVVGSFTDWAVEAEPRLRQALTALFGVEEGLEATAEALAFAWERWSEVVVMENPVGYVYGAARNMGRRRLVRRPVFLPVPPEQRTPWVEPGLPSALAGLSEQQRLVVALLHGYQWTMSEVAELLGISKSTVQNHDDRGLRTLRLKLGVGS
jgi:DNA-directed RNA polymerase specialized sigma24 family protein